MGCGASQPDVATEARGPPPGPKRQVSLKEPNNGHSAANVNNARATGSCRPTRAPSPSFKPEKHGDDFVTRRLSVINPFDAGEAAEGEGEEKAGEGF